MPHRDPPAVSVAFGQLADEVDVHFVGTGPDIEMDVHVPVELERELEDAPDLTGGVRVVPGCAAHDGGTPIERRDDVPVGLRHVGPALLREDAKLEIDGPGIVGRELPERLEGPKPDVRVHLHVGSDMRRAVENALLQRRGGPGVHVLDGEPGLDRGHPLHVVAGAPRGGCATVHDARLVEVDVGLDEAGRDQLPAEVDGGRRRRRRRNGGSAPRRRSCHPRFRCPRAAHRRPRPRCGPPEARCPTSSRTLPRGPSVRDAEEQREGSVDGQHVGVVEASEDIAEPPRAGREGLVDHHE